MQSIIQILKRNEPKAWQMADSRTGAMRNGFSHSAECILLTADGQVDQVGVLKIKGEDLIAKAQPGIYYGSFAMQANVASRAIEAVLVDLQPIKKTGNGFVPVEAPKAQ